MCHVYPVLFVCYGIEVMRAMFMRYLLVYAETFSRKFLELKKVQIAILNQGGCEEGSI
jgi:hypothetical protein